MIVSVDSVRVIILQAITLKPDVARYFFVRGVAFNKLGELQKCLMDLSMAVRVDPKTPTYLEHKASCLRRMGRTEDAIVDYTKAIQMDPDNGNLYYNRGVAYASSAPRNYEAALPDFDAAVKLCDSEGQCTIVGGS